MTDSRKKTPQSLAPEQRSQNGRDMAFANNRNNKGKQMSGITTITTAKAADEQQHSNAKLLLTVAEACQALGISPWYLNRHVQAGAIKSIKLGKRRLFSVRALEEFITQLEQQGDGAVE